MLTILLDLVTVMVMIIALTFIALDMATNRNGHRGPDRVFDLFWGGVFAIALVNAALAVGVRGWIALLSVAGV